LIRQSKKLSGRGTLAIALTSATIFVLLLAGCTVFSIDFSPTPPGPTATPTTPPTPTPVPRALRGRVLDKSTSTPLEGVEVIAGGILTVTTTDGSFYFDDVPKWSKLTASSQGYDTVETDTGVVTELDVLMRPNTVTGRVTDSSTGEPLANVLVKLVLPQAPPAPAPPITETAPVTGTVEPTATVSTTTGTMGYGKLIAAPAQVEGPVLQTTVTATAVVTATPAPPTATPTPKPIPPTGEGFVAVYTDENGSYFFKDVPEGATLTFKMPGYKLTRLPAGDAAKKDMALEQFRVEAIYLTANVAASPDLLDELLEFVSKSRINAVVVNVQNDASEWVYDTKNPDVLAAKNTDIFLPDMGALVQKLKARGLYTIARVVTFQQKTMVDARPDWSVLSDVTGKPWKGGYVGQQKWLDASNPAVQDHLVAMTNEVLSLGFDEIQYDYVRFPSDPAPSEPGEMVFSRPLTDTTKTLALQEFLKKAKNTIDPTDAFMSIDVFGYSLWPDREEGPILGLIGQVMESMIPYTDYVCPMIYPSHFSPGEQGCDTPAACAYELVRKSGEFAAERFKGQRAKYRPWLQDFDWPPVDYTSPGTRKVADQIRACRETNCWGWQWWDPANVYEPRSAFQE
jgi:hypothetical protein